MNRTEFARTEAKLDTLRVPPQSAEAEQSVLGGIFLDPDSLFTVQAILKEEMFYRRDHRLIYRALVALKDKARDVVTVGEWFQQNGLAEQIGGTGYLIELASNTPSAANIKAYAEIVREKYLMRRVIEEGTEIVNVGFKPEGRTIEDVIGDSASRLSSILEVRQDASVSLRSAAKGMFDRIIERYEHEGDDLSGISTGYEKLDDLLGGLQNGRVYGVGGRAKMGKSILALNMIETALFSAKLHAALWSFEMDRNEVAQRLACARAGINYKFLQHPKLMGDFEWGAMQGAMKDLSEANLTIFDPPTASIEAVEAQATVLKAKGKLNLIAIDYLGLMELPDMERHDLKLGHITRSTKQMAKRLDVPVILLFQLNRGNEQGSVRVPRASDARDSGSIEQDLDAMILVHRPSYYDKNAAKGARVEVAIQRNGPTGVIRLEDHLERCRFGHSDLDWVEPKAQKEEERATRRAGF